MQNSPLVSVICLCYNHADFVIESLNSVINQKYQNIQLIVADDFSSDDSVAVIEKWRQQHPEIVFIKNETNLGNTKTFNRAYTHAKGDYIMDLAADDVLLPHCIELQLQAFENNSDGKLGVVYGNVANITEKGDFESYFFPVNQDRKAISKRPIGDVYAFILSGHDSMCSVSALYKRVVFDTLQGYDETLAYEDLDFWIRAARSYHFDFVDDVLVQKRISPSSMTLDFKRKRHERAKKINFSTYRILQKALKLNCSKEEDKALQQRLHYELIQAWETRNFKLVFLYVLLKLKLMLRMLKNVY